MTDARPSALLLAERPEAGELLPHVVAWNLTKRCNLRCSHCYISAGPFESAESELTTAECHRVIDELLAVNPSPMLILSGGEPLLRQDLEEIASHASGRGATVVVGTNGTTLTEPRVAMLKRAGVSGVAVSVDSLDEGVHDHFRGGAKALERTKEALSHLREQRIDVVVQTTATPRNVAEIPALLEWAAEEGAVCFNLYFLVPTGRGVDLLDLAPQRIETLLAELAAAETRYRGRMMVRAKCAPHFMRHVHAADPDSPVLSYRTRCPCGIDYCRITPDGKLTPCPYMPSEAGDLRRQSFGEVWSGSKLFAELRERKLGGRCGSCEYRMVCGGCRARAGDDRRPPRGGPRLCLPAARRPAARRAQERHLRQRCRSRPFVVARSERADGEDPVLRARRRDAEGRGLRARPGVDARDARAAE